jgi:hypothetical protein
MTSARAAVVGCLVVTLGASAARAQDADALIEQGVELRTAGLVEARVDAQRRVYRLRPEPLMAVDTWLAPFRRFWSARVDALERHLDRMDDAPPKPKARTPGTTARPTPPNKIRTTPKGRTR